MKGTKNRLAAIGVFSARNRRLLMFILMFMAGVLAGVLLFLTAHPSMLPSLTRLLADRPLPGGLADAAAAAFDSCFAALMLLLVLFLSGMTAFGAPMALLVPMFYGLSAGLTEAFYYAQGGFRVAYVALLVLPHTLVAAFGLLLASSETLRMSLLMGGQLLPGTAGCGGLWADFRLYLMRFVTCCVIVAVSGAVETGLRLLFQPWLAG